ncbi:NSFL1C [Cordylochernes scorpioides]|uniref:NSFL1C n=1 Tax=Cordylochernes scorpioides TaxID=51811 RepID=A0ABY6K570_9ARAC|nr:NSFL1C [Cordylochernes scorpioides]
MHTGQSRGEARVTRLVDYKHKEAVSHYFDNPIPDSPEEPTLPQATPSEPSSYNGPSRPRAPPSGPSLSPWRFVFLSRITTLTSLLSGGGGHEDDEEGQAFYAGGSERSGQQVIGPSKKNYPEIVEQMFKAAQNRGAQLVDSAQPKRKPLFQGQGHRLGSSLNEESAPVVPQSPEDEPVEVSLVLWQNGFTLDSGPLRPYSDPSSMAFLEAVRRGEIPAEIRAQHLRREVNVNMKDNRHQSYTAPPSLPQMFAGTGHRLGSPMPSLPTEHPAQDLKDCQKQAESGLALNPDQPTTNIQIRLADGSRVVIRCNHTHTLADIRQYIVTYPSTLSLSCMCTTFLGHHLKITLALYHTLLPGAHYCLLHLNLSIHFCMKPLTAPHPLLCFQSSLTSVSSARPEYGSQLFSLVTQYPMRELSDDSTSLKDLELLNTSLLLKLK